MCRTNRLKMNLIRSPRRVMYKIFVQVKRSISWDIFLLVPSRVPAAGGRDVKSMQSWWISYLFIARLRLRNRSIRTYRSISDGGRTYCWLSVKQPMSTSVRWRHADPGLYCLSPDKHCAAAAAMSSCIDDVAMSMRSNRCILGCTQAVLTGRQHRTRSMMTARCHG